VVHPASIQDRDGGLFVLKAVRRLFPFIERIFADGGYQGPITAAAVQVLGPWQLQIVKRSDHAVGFEVLPKRWIVERTFAWLGRCRRLAKDYLITHFSQPAGEWYKTGTREWIGGLRHGAQQRSVSEGSQRDALR
jgi:transposase